MAYNRIAAIGEATTGTIVTLTNKTILQDMNNCIHFCDDFTLAYAVNPSSTLITLPNSISKPSQTIYFVIPFKNANNVFSPAIMLLDTNGNIKSNSGEKGTYYLGGHVITLNNKFYNNTIGNNNESTMSSPLIYE